MGIQYEGKMYYYSAYIPDLVTNLYDALPPENKTEMLPLGIYGGYKNKADEGFIYLDFGWGIRT